MILVYLLKTSYYAKISEIKSEIRSITGLATTAALDDAKNKISSHSDWVKQTNHAAKIRYGG